MLCYDDFPTSLVAVNVVEALAALAVGVMIIGQFGSWALLAYLLVGLVAVLLSLAFGCTRCYYYGRVCAMGLGKICRVMFKKRDEEEFGKSLSQTISWTLVGAVLVLPLAAGLISLWADFGLSRLLWLAAFLGLMLVILVTHSRFSCSLCREAKERRCSLGRLGESF
jgi:hypothetical protein